MGQITRTNFGFLVTKDFTNAQVIAWPTTALTILAAQGVGKIIRPMYATVALKWAADYSAIDAGARIEFVIGIGTHASTLVIMAPSLALPSDLLAIGESTFVSFASDMAIDGVGNNTAPLTSLSVSDYENLPLTMTFDNNGGAATLGGGDPANVLRVTVAVMVFTMPS